MSEMIERVARAIAYKARLKHADKASAEEYAEFGWPQWVESAKTAIEAMREPTEAMIQTGDDEFSHTLNVARPIWQRMIDAALDTPSQITPNQAGS